MYLWEVKAPAEFTYRRWIFDRWLWAVRVRSHRAALFFVLRCYATRCAAAFSAFGQTERKVVPCGRIFLSNAIPDQIRIGWTVVEWKLRLEGHDQWQLYVSMFDRCGTVIWQLFQLLLRSSLYGPFVQWWFNFERNLKHWRRFCRSKLNHYSTNVSKYVKQLNNMLHVNNRVVVT